jgi:chemotaxis protein methyltransferase CheR
MDERARERLRQLATDRLGLASSALVDARIDDALSRLGGNVAEALDALTSLSFDTPLWQTVVAALTIGETNFFRQPGWFSQLEQQVLGPAIERRRASGPKHLRIWSAGCATGEEAYSLAMLVARLLRGTQGWSISIVGTDLNTAALGEARRGVYREWSLRDVDAATRLLHFQRLASGRFELAPATRALVRFQTLNLAADEPWTDPRLSNLDLIVCRNVLMYLSPERQRAVAQRLIASLAPDGWIATAPAEATADWFRPLTPVNVPSAVLFRRAAPVTELPRGDDDLASVVAPARPARRAVPDRVRGDLSDSAVALAAARRALDASIRRSTE